MSYYFTKIVNCSFDEAVAEVTKELKKQGFGILTEIDVRETLKSKLNVDLRPYKILGACNPPNAYKAILAEENIGLMLPCNVIIYEKDGKTVLSVIRPTIAMQMINNGELQKAAEAVEAQLKKAFDAIT